MTINMDVSLSSMRTLKDLRDFMEATQSLPNEAKIRFSSIESSSYMNRGSKKYSMSIHFDEKVSDKGDN